MGVAVLSSCVLVEQFAVHFVRKGTVRGSMESFAEVSDTVTECEG